MALNTCIIVLAAIIAALLSIPQPPQSPHRPMRVEQVAVGIPSAKAACAEQTWPNLAAACLRGSQSNPSSGVRVVNGKS